MTSVGSGSALSSSCSSPCGSTLLPPPSSISILPSPWVADDDRDSCFQCAKPFHVLTSRRHHCRLCGEVFCSNETTCWGKKATIPRGLPLAATVVTTKPSASSSVRVGGEGGGAPGASSMSSPSFRRQPTEDASDNNNPAAFAASSSSFLPQSTSSPPQTIPSNSDFVLVEASDYAEPTSSPHAASKSTSSPPHNNNNQQRRNSIRDFFRRSSVTQNSTTTRASPPPSPSSGERMPSEAAGAAGSESSSAAAAAVLCLACYKLLHSNPFLTALVANGIAEASFPVVPPSLHGGVIVDGGGVMRHSAQDMTTNHHHPVGDATLDLSSFLRHPTTTPTVVVSPTTSSSSYGPTFPPQQQLQRAPVGGVPVVLLRIRKRRPAKAATGSAVGSSKPSSMMQFYAQRRAQQQQQHQQKTSASQKQSSQSQQFLKASDSLRNPLGSGRQEQEGSTSSRSSSSSSSSSSCTGSGNNSSRRGLPLNNVVYDMSLRQWRPFGPQSVLQFVCPCGCPPPSEHTRHRTTTATTSQHNGYSSNSALPSARSGLEGEGGATEGRASTSSTTPSPAAAGAAAPVIASPVNSPSFPSTPSRTLSPKTAVHRAEEEGDDEQNVPSAHSSNGGALQGAALRRALAAAAKDNATTDGDASYPPEDSRNIEVIFSGKSGGGWSGGTAATGETIFPTPPPALRLRRHLPRDDFVLPPSRSSRQRLRQGERGAATYDVDSSRSASPSSRCSPSAYPSPTSPALRAEREGGGGGASHYDPLSPLTADVATRGETVAGVQPADGCKNGDDNRQQQQEQQWDNPLPCRFRIHCDRVLRSWTEPLELDKPQKQSPSSSPTAPRKTGEAVATVIETQYYTLSFRPATAADLARRPCCRTCPCCCNGSSIKGHPHPQQPSSLLAQAMQSSLLFQSSPTISTPTTAKPTAAATAATTDSALPSPKEDGTSSRSVGAGNHHQDAKEGQHHSSAQSHIFTQPQPPAATAGGAAADVVARALETICELSKSRNRVRVAACSGGGLKLGKRSKS